MADSMLLDALHGVGTVFDLPRRGVYKLGNLAYKGLTGDRRPDVEHFSELLERLGMDPESFGTKALGFVGDIATDPLTYAGGALARAGVRAFTSPAKVTQSLGRSLRPAESLAAGSKFAPLRHEVMKFSDVGKEGGEEILSRLGGPELHQAPYSRGGVPRKGTFVAEIPERVDLSKYEGMFPEVEEGLVDLDELLPSHEPAFRGRLRGGLRGHAPEEVEEAFRAAAPRLTPTTAGQYHPEERVITLAGGGMSPLPIGDERLLTGRHELVHALIDRAAEQAAEFPETARRTLGDLPLAMRIPARLRQAALLRESPLLQSLSLIGDETAAHALQSRGLLDQIRGGAQFLFNPERNLNYASKFADMPGFDPLVRRMYRALPSVPVAAGAAIPQGMSSFLREV